MGPEIFSSCGTGIGLQRADVYSCFAVRVATTDLPTRRKLDGETPFPLEGRHLILFRARVDFPVVQTGTCHFFF